MFKTNYNIYLYKIIMTEYQKEKRRKKKEILQNKYNNLYNLLKNKEYDLKTYNNLISNDILNELNTLKHTNLEKIEIINIQKKLLTEKMKEFNNIPNEYNNIKNKEKSIWLNENERIKQKMNISKGEIINKIINLNNTQTKYQDIISNHKNNLIIYKNYNNNLKFDNYKVRKNIINDLKIQHKQRKDKENNIKKLNKYIKENNDKINEFNSKLQNIPNIKREINKTYYIIINDISINEKELKQVNINIEQLLNNQNNEDINNEIKTLWKIKEEKEKNIENLKCRPELNIQEEFKRLDDTISKYKDQIHIHNEQIQQLTILKNKGINELNNIKYNSERVNNNFEDLIKIKENKNYSINKINEFEEKINILIEEKTQLQNQLNDNNTILEEQKIRSDERLEIVNKRLLTYIDDQEIKLKQEICDINNNIDNITKILTEINNNIELKHKEINVILESNNINSTLYYNLINNINTINYELNEIQKQM